MQLLSKLKKLLIIGIAISLCGCSVIGTKDKDPDEKYVDMIELIETYDNFLTSSDYFDISAEKVISNADGYRFYITIDNVRVAMYDVEVIAIEEGVDYTEEMAANVGIFEDIEYKLIPNQSNPDKGFYKGIVISGTTVNEECAIHVLVQWKSKDLLVTKREYLVVNI